ncbi:MmcB family DNA repair protein [Sphingomonas endophytica]|uniref:Transcription elongation factor n=1 Tax=Sphingomonas endophytica TaxID=869719 RepID=A0A147I7X3_9SPHN|nr:MmcB family DNA repair protein [Sphingomonas endophytica]KTT75254.1 transcription elongation factor [Sphingomonas endophytica]
MLTPPDTCRNDSTAALCAADVARGVTRMLLRHDLTAIAEVPLDGGRRADLMAIDPRGQLVIVEIKVSRADLLGDGKWQDYLAHCDRFYWAVPAGFDAAPIAGAAFLPERTGLIVADRYDAAIVREARTDPLSAPTRKRCTLAFARRAARRLIAAHDPDATQGF